MATADQLLEIMQKVKECYEFVYRIHKQMVDPSEQHTKQLAFTFEEVCETNVDDMNDNIITADSFAYTKGMRKNFYEFYKLLYAKYAFNEFDADDEFIFITAAGCRIVDFRDAITRVSGSDKKGFMEAQKVNNRHKTYKFIKHVV